MGIGFPPMTGGAAQFMTGYEDPETGDLGLPAFVKRADALAEKHGDRFRPHRPPSRDGREGRDLRADLANVTEAPVVEPGERQRARVETPGPDT